jgi:maltose O-acetyltransferase
MNYFFSKLKSFSKYFLRSTRSILFELKKFIHKGQNNSDERIRNITISQSAKLFPEAIIENLSEDKEKIIISSNSYIRGRLTVSASGGLISIGEWCYVGHRSEIFSLSSISIGNRVMIAHDVNIVDNTAHSLDPIERHNHFRHTINFGRPKRREDLPGVSSAPIIIEDDVWISFGVTILKGVTIGTRSVIAARAIVTHDVPPDVIYKCKIEPQITSLTQNKSKT